MILLATGSEVNLSIETAKLLREREGLKVRVVSMPSMELFEQQDCEYMVEVLPSDTPFIVSVEAASTYGWNKYADLCIGLDHFGASAPYKVLAEKFGFTPEGVFNQIMDVISADCGCGDDDCDCGCDCGCEH
jgi:transketolase